MTFTQIMAIWTPGITLQDHLNFMLKALRFLCTCPVMADAKSSAWMHGRVEYQFLSEKYNVLYSIDLDQSVSKCREPHAPHYDINVILCGATSISSNFQCVH